MEFDENKKLEVEISETEFVENPHSISSTLQ